MKVYKRKLNNCCFVLFSKTLVEQVLKGIKQHIVLCNRVSVAQADLELLSLKMISLPLPTKYWDHRQMASSVDLKYYFTFFVVVCFILFCPRQTAGI